MEEKGINGLESGDWEGRGGFFFDAFMIEIIRVFVGGFLGILGDFFTLPEPFFSFRFYVGVKSWVRPGAVAVEGSTKKLSDASDWSRCANMSFGSFNCSMKDMIW